MPGADEPTLNPNYHSSTDTIDTLNLGLHLQISRAILATVATFANLTDQPAE